MKPSKRVSVFVSVLAGGMVGWFVWLDLRTVPRELAHPSEFPLQPEGESLVFGEISQPQIVEEVKLAETSPPPTSGPTNRSTVSWKQVIPGLQWNAAPLSWERQISEVKARTSDPTSAAQAILGLLSYLPEEALETAVQEAMTMLPDEGWRRIALPLLLNPQTHGRVQSVLLADLMERPKTIFLPSLLDVAGTPAHPLADFALDDLRLFLGENFKLGDATIESVIHFRKETPEPAENSQTQKPIGATPVE